MKTLKVIPVLLFSLIFIFITGFSSRASNPAMAPAEHIQKIIKESLRYPAQAVRNGSSGMVELIFTVDDEGKINIKKSFTDNPEIERIVKEQLSSVCCKGVRPPVNAHYQITITYKLLS